VQDDEVVVLTETDEFAVGGGHSPGSECEAYVHVEIARSPTRTTIPSSRIPRMAPEALYVALSFYFFDIPLGAELPQYLHCPDCFQASITPL